MNQRTGVPCPKCKEEVVYNGNYFCSECSWVMPEKYDVVPFLTGLRDMAIKNGDTFMVERCNFYLENHYEKPR